MRIKRLGPGSRTSGVVEDIVQNCQQEAADSTGNRHRVSENLLTKKLVDEETKQKIKLLGGPEGPEPALGTSLDQPIPYQELRWHRRPHLPAFIARWLWSPVPPEPQPASSGCSVQGRPDVH